MKVSSPNPNLTTTDVLEALRASGKPLHEWGQAIDGTPMLAARTGGDKQPAIFITAGSHSPETAGVHAALNLLHALDTEHEVHILPLRDPLGVDGVNRCLSFATGHTVEVPSHRAALDYLLDHGQLNWREENVYIIGLGDIGFVWDTPRPGMESFLSIHARMLALAREDPDVLEPFRGQSVMLMCAMPDVEGTGEMLRCWHGVVSLEGEWLHLNRFFGREDAPPEVAALDRLMQAVRPGLTCDLHEGAGQGFYMPTRKPKENPERAFEMTKAFLDYIQTRGYPITTYEQWVAVQQKYSRNYPSDWTVPEPRLPGMFWSDGLMRNEGYNLSDYARLFGISRGTEAPVQRPLAMRVDGITHGILAAIKVWEQGDWR
jgi:hypothetical protein